MCKVVGGPDMDPEQIVADFMRDLGWENTDSEALTTADAQVNELHDRISEDLTNDADWCPPRE